MTTAKFSTAYIRALDADRFRAYLYETSAVVGSVLLQGEFGDVVLLVVKTVGKDAERIDYLQQYQADRLASGMLPLIIGFDSQTAAAAWLAEHARKNGDKGNLLPLYPQGEFDLEEHPHICSHEVFTTQPATRTVCEEVATVRLNVPWKTGTAYHRYCPWHAEQGLAAHPSTNLVANIVRFK